NFLRVGRKMALVEFLYPAPGLISIDKAGMRGAFFRAYLIGQAIQSLKMLAHSFLGDLINRIKGHAGLTFPVKARTALPETILIPHETAFLDHEIPRHIGIDKNILLRAWRKRR